MDIGKITQKLGELTQDIKKNVLKNTQCVQNLDCQEFSKNASKAMRSYGLSQVIFKKTGTPKGELKVNIRKYLDFLHKYEKENGYDPMVKHEKPIKAAKEILKATNDTNISLMNTFLENPSSFNFRKASIFELLKNIEDEKTAQELSALFKRYFSNEEAIDNSELFSIMLSELQYTKTADDKGTQAMLEIINAWLDDSQLSKNYRLNSTFKELLQNSLFNPDYTKDVLDFLKKMVGKNGLYKDNIDFLNSAGSIFDIYSPKTLEARKNFIEKLSITNTVPRNNIGLVLSYLNERNSDIIETCTFTPLIRNNFLFDLNYLEIYRLSSEKEAGDFIRSMLDEYINNPALAQDDRMQKHISGILKSAKDKYKVSAIKSILRRCKQYPELYKTNIGAVMEYTSKENKDFTVRFLTQKEMYENHALSEYIGEILQKITRKPDSQGLMDEVFETYQKRPELKNINIGAILSEIEPEKMTLFTKYINTPELYQNNTLRSCIGKILKNYTPENKENIDKIIETYLSRPELKDINLGKLLYSISKDNIEFIEKYLDDPILYKNGIINVKLDYILKNYSQELLDIDGLRKILKELDKEAVLKISENINDLFTLSRIIDLHGISNLNQLSFNQKRKLLRNLMSSNTDVFSASKTVDKKAFPLIPTSKDDYCKLLPALVKSMGIQTKKLTPKQIQKFNTSLFDLSEILGKMSDENFAKLKIEQSYSRESFIKDVLEKIKDLDEKEKQKVFDYFGFELQPNTTNSTGFTIAGYPINLNNGEKLAQINNEKTTEIIEVLRKNIIAFSENNRVISNDKSIEDLINEICNLVPEIRTMIDKPQHKTHHYDLIKHTLKVMAKISQNADFQELNPSDKKITLLTALFHDITKAEGKVSPIHGNESAFDAFYIAKKFNLNQAEEIKLNTLIKHHEWLSKVNKAKGQDVITNQQSVAYDMQDDNIFKIAQIFTQADLKAVKKDDEFYLKFKKDFERHTKKIEELIDQLRSTQPILPVTKLPDATSIADKIKYVNSDFSTNIKGLYKTPDGAIVIKFNEVQDWEALGFPKGTVSRGIKTVSEADKKPINTGNIKFIVHGLDESEQLARFDAFTLPDSDALLSVSYTERPESKYRFFRTQGVILDTNTSNIHGGGNTDAGSGCKKTVDTFKNNYIFGGEREEDRKYISNLIKKALNLTDSEYIEFVKKWKNKSMLEIEPQETREKLIKAMAQINSSHRHGNRSYNEMYISNPKVMGVFAYAPDDKVGKIQNFIQQESLDFLRDYAAKNNIPFIVFGD